VGRAATAAAARPTRTAPSTHGTNGRGDAPSGERAVRGEAGAAQARVAARRAVRARGSARGASARTGPRGPAAAAVGISAAVAVPIRVLNAPFARSLRARTARVLDALLSGRGWIALIGVLLVGIVFFNVDLLRMNRDIARNAEKASALKRHNARLRLDVARLGSSERIQKAAADLGLVLPAPGQVRYLKARPALDARRAAKRITEPVATLLPPAPALTSPGSTLPSAPTTPPAGTTPPASTTPPATTTPPAATTPPTGAAIPPATTTTDGTVTPQATAPGTTGQAIAPAGGQLAPPTTGTPAP
jgi:cell division protein FtsL